MRETGGHDHRTSSFEGKTQLDFHVEWPVGDRDNRRNRRKEGRSRKPSLQVGLTLRFLVPRSDAAAPGWSLSNSRRSRRHRDGTPPGRVGMAIEDIVVDEPDRKRAGDAGEGAAQREAVARRSNCAALDRKAKVACRRLSTEVGTSPVPAESQRKEDAHEEHPMLAPNRVCGH